MTPNSQLQDLNGLYTEGKVRIYTGRYVDPFNMKADDIDIRDIAHSLSHQCRFAGHTKKFYSVAQHCIFTMKKVSDENRLEALLHDASEAYLLDIPTPIKKQLTGYAEAEERIMKLVAEKFGFNWPMSEDVKAADRIMLQEEWEQYVIADARIPWSTYQAEQTFLFHFEQLTHTRVK